MNISRLADAIAELTGQITAVDVVVCMGGVLVLVVWLLKTSFGTKALVASPMRRNNMHPFVALIPLLVWFGAVSVLAYIKKNILADLPGWQNALADNLILCISVAPAVAAGVIIARTYFARRLKGLGLNPQTVVRDLGTASLNLLAIMPVVLAAVILTTLVGKLVVGPEFQMPRHEELNQIIGYPQWQVRAMIVFTAVVVVPFVEELIFRGMIQTLLRSYIVRPWPAVVFASLVFAAFHENPQHWPALFALSVCLGYSYEKSGSLFRSIFIHSMFNALSVFAALWQ